MVERLRGITVMESKKAEQSLFLVGQAVQHDVQTVRDKMDNSISELRYQLLEYDVNQIIIEVLQLAAERDEANLEPATSYEKRNIRTLRDIVERNKPSLTPANDTVLVPSGGWQWLWGIGDDVFCIPTPTPDFAVLYQRELELQEQRRLDYRKRIDDINTMAHDLDVFRGTIAAIRCTCKHAFGSRQTTQRVCIPYARYGIWIGFTLYYIRLLPDRHLPLCEDTTCRQLAEIPIQNCERFQQLYHSEGDRSARADFRRRWYPRKFANDTLSYVHFADFNNASSSQSGLNGMSKAWNAFRPSRGVWMLTTFKRGHVLLCKNSRPIAQTSEH